MKLNKLHLIFWIIYFLIAYISDIILDPTVVISSEIIIFITHNIFLFYGILFLIRQFALQKNNHIVKPIFYSLLLILIFLSFKYTINNRILPVIYPIGYEEPSTKVWITVCTLWIINYFFFACAYFYFERSIQRQKELNKTTEEKLLQEKRNLELENTLLRAQINPHFLYNALNFLYAKALPLSAALSDAIMKLSDIMRYSLRPHEANGLVLVTDEIEHIENVISLARLRFKNEISLHFSFKGDFGNTKIPALTFITLVENVLKYGCLNEPESPAKVDIEIMDGHTLKFATWNKKRFGPKEASTSIGLVNTSKRLKEAYPGHCTITIVDDVQTFSTEILLALTTKASNS